MDALIIEIVGKTRKDFAISFSDKEKGVENYENVKFSGDNIWDDFETYYLNNLDKFGATKSVAVTNRFHDLAYLSKFKNLEKLWIHHSGIPLKFPDLKSFIQLGEVHINGQGKPSSYENLNTAPNLRKLYIGDWSLPSPVKISSFSVILKCLSLEKLFLSHIKIEQGSIRELASLGSLKELTLPQSISVEDLAFLSAKLPAVSSMELRAYQECNSNYGNIKVNGKRMPYLDKDRDMKKLKTFEEEFERLKNTFQDQ